MESTRKGSKLVGTAGALAIAGVCVLASFGTTIKVATAAILRPSGVRENPLQEAAEDALRKSATPLTDKNERQRLEGIHSDFPVSDRHVDLLDELKRTGKDTGWYSPGGIMFQDPSQTEALGVTIARKAALVVIGTVQQTISLLNEHNTGVFTESEIEVSEVLKADPSNPLSRGAHIFLVRTGGVVRVGDHFIEDITGSETLLHKGDKCLLFLTPVNEAAGAFSGGTFLIEGKDVKDCDDQGKYFGSLEQARRSVKIASGGANQFRS